MGQNNDFMKGALLGGLLGGAAGLLAAPKSGKELREEITENYNSLSDKAHDFTDAIKEKGSRLAHPFQIKEEEESFSTNGFLVGGAVGAVIGATVAMLLAPKAGEKLREELGDKYEGIREQAEHFVNNFSASSKNAFENVGDWKETLMSIVEKVSQGKKKPGHSKMDDMVDWAGLGIRLLQQLQKGR